MLKRINVENQTVLAVSGGNSLEEVDNEFMLFVLDNHKGNRTHAARSLGISTRTLQRRLKRMGVQ